MAEGHSNHGIATALVITEDAVEKHVRSILRKLNLPPTASRHRRVLAVLAYLRSTHTVSAACNWPVDGHGRAMAA
jgi:DNA-binding NarL/FixJ family response regulator